MVNVKICGITNLLDAKQAVEVGCDALGFMFYKKSPRYVSPDAAQKIIRALPKGIIKIGVFVNAKEKDIRKVAKMCHLDMLQFHGEESAQFCQRFKDFKLIKVFRVKKRINLRDILKYKVFAYLFDTYLPTKKGGTGRQFNWNLVAQLGSLQSSVFLSGGLNAKNVARAIKTVGPQWVDASSSLEVKPGIKDPRAVKKFIEVAKAL